MRPRWTWVAPRVGKALSGRVSTRRACVVVLHASAPFLALLVATITASAEQQHPVSLTWSAPGGCPSGERVVARVEQLLSRAKPVTERLVAEATISTEEDGLRLHLSASNGDLRRTVQADACDELADAAALILALWLAPSLLSEGNRRERADESAAPAIAPTQPQRPSDPPAHRAGPDWRLLAGLAIDYGSLPTLAPGLQAGGGLESSRLEATLSGQWFPRSSRQLAESTADRAAKGGKFSLLTGMLRVCYEPFASLTLAACGTGELGALHAEGYGTAVEEQRSTLWAAMGPGVAIRVPTREWVAFRATADLLFGLRRPSFVLENVGPVYSPNRATLRLAAGVLLRFP
jgi:hypothetical protein